MDYPEKETAPPTTGRSYGLGKRQPSLIGVHFVLGGTLYC